MVFQCLGHVSGAHVNPAVTVGLLSAGHVFLLRAVMYIAAQCAGAIAAAVVLKALTPEESESTLGVTAVSPHLTLTQAVFVEAFITFFLVMTVFGARSARGSAGFAIGVSITTCHLFAMQYTGASMNPARSLGPAMVTGVWHNHWVYWMGPLAGGIAAGAMSSCLFRPSVPKAPVRPTQDSEHRDNPTKEMEELTGQLHQKVIKTKDRKKVRTSSIVVGCMGSSSAVTGVGANLLEDLQKSSSILGGGERIKITNEEQLSWKLQQGPRIFNVEVWIARKSDSAYQCLDGHRCCFSGSIVTITMIVCNIG
ncbi:aquaporin AQPAe.a-like [Schistocerca americana]|uniref:aquaporin AQPAe.a-like n=1 Tax=Schistocerca americana TaxID=7009 RepID=UPI001F4F5520|nr:aquaporin AQPAe.a-like [Schistocerca americana]